MLERGRWSTVLTALAQRVTEKFPATMSSPALDWPLFEPLVGAIGAARYRRALREANIGIVNQPRGDMQPLPWLQFDELGRPGPVTLVQDEADDELWIVMRGPAQRHTNIGRLRTSYAEIVHSSPGPRLALLVNSRVPGRGTPFETLTLETVLLLERMKLELGG